MPRKARVEFPGAVVSRAIAVIGRETILRDDADRIALKSAENLDLPLKTLPLYSALFCFLLMTGVASAQKEFTQIAPDVIVANKEMADEVMELSYKEADGTWVPTNDQVRIGFDRLRSEQGAAEIKATAPRWLDMSPSLQRISLSRYQVFGLILGGGKQILYYASPKDDTIKIDWLEHAICLKTFDGGAQFWWVFYDVQSGHFVASSRRP